MAKNVKDEEYHCCGTCKHFEKKITESPCDECDGWCRKWEARTDERSGSTL